MFKNVIITILSILALFLWLSNDPEDLYDDPDDVTIEYKCSVIREYKHVPPEVLEECRKRKNVTEDVDNKTSV
jgi:hypothetical protein